MGSRRQGREIALQALYRAEVTGDAAPESLELLWQHFEAPAGARQFAIELVRGVLADRERIDRLLADAAEHWSLSRLSRVDLSILRIATFEMLQHRPGVPTSVAIDEAIEIARRYGGEESSQFVNGLLDHVAGRLGIRERREAAAKES
jgi:N utilization substance protein B